MLGEYTNKKMAATSPCQLQNNTMIETRCYPSSVLCIRLWLCLNFNICDIFFCYVFFSFQFSKFGQKLSISQNAQFALSVNTDQFMIGLNLNDSCEWRTSWINGLTSADFRGNSQLSQIDR